MVVGRLGECPRSPRPGQPRVPYPAAQMEQELASRLVTVILADENVTEADWNFVNTSLLDIALDGIDQARYSEILDELRSTLTDRVSPALIDPGTREPRGGGVSRRARRPALDALAAVVDANLRAFWSSNAS